MIHTKRGQLRSGARLAVVLGAALFFISAGAIDAIAQVAMMSVAGDEGNPSGAFSVHKPPQAVLETLEDFERFRDKQAWEKALSALDKAYDADASGLIPSDDGIMLPVAAKMQQELLSLPPAGREAFRLFNDAKAQSLYQAAINSADDDSGAPAADSLDNVNVLRAIVDRYFVSSIGDKAADRLGDALFEAGDFAGAQRQWRMIIDHYPDTTLSPALLQTKRAIAFARAGRWEEFQQIRALVHDRFAGQTVTLGGSEIAADQYLDELGKSAKSAGPTTRPQAVTASTIAEAVADDGSAAMPANNTPIWQIPIMDETTEKQIETALSQYGWQSMAASITGRPPAVAVDDKRIYVNAVGECFAADLTTGKMLWRTDVISNLGQVIQQSFMYGGGMDFANTQIAIDGDRLFLIRRPRSEMNGQPGPPQDAQMRLFCVHADSGKEIWKSSDGPLSAWSFLGHVLISGNTLYVCAHAPQSQDLHLLNIASDNGQLLSDLPLGNATGGSDFRGQPVVKAPDLLEHDGNVYVLTNNGMLLAVDPHAQILLWAFSYPTQLAGPQQQVVFVNNGGGGSQSDPPARGSMAVRGSTLYFKEDGDDTLYALDISGPSLIYKRPIGETVALAGVDDSGVLLVGAEADRIDASTRALLWSDRLYVATSDIHPVFRGGRIYNFTLRGVHSLNAASGDTDPVFYGEDRQGLGGGVWFSGDRLMTVSNWAITAYPLAGKGPP